MAVMLGEAFSREAGSIAMKDFTGPVIVHVVLVGVGAYLVGRDITRRKQGAGSSTP